MKIPYAFVPMLAAGLTMSSCGGNDGKTNEEQQQDTVVAEEAAASESAIKLSPATGHQEFDNPKLTLAAPTGEATLQAGKNNFQFEVESEKYQLGAQTQDADMVQCANSDKGQHIHFIRNNEPYEAHYTATFESELKEGNNLIVAFLSRSYHESVKDQSALVVKNLVVGEPTENIDLNASHLIYSRPKGTYSGKDTERVLLDFYLLNEELSANGHQVRATINGEEFMLDTWQPYFIEGLPMGENTIRLELVDENGTLVPGPFNDSGERTITLEG